MQGTIKSQPGAGYTIFDRAERLNLTVTKLLTGRDAPLLSLEMVLQNTYALAKERIQKQHSKGKGKRH